MTVVFLSTLDENTRYNLVCYILDQVTTFYRNNNYMNCCIHCGSTTEPVSYCDEDNTAYYMCDSCFSRVQANIPVTNKSRGNIFTGIVGAFIGALLGMVIWFLIYQLGYIAGLAGLAIAALTIKGYELLGGKLNIAGIIICIILTIGAVFFVQNICYSYEIYDFYKGTYDITFFDAYKALPDFLENMSELKAAFIKDLVIGYLLTAVASASIFYTAFKSQNIKPKTLTKYND